MTVTAAALKPSDRWMANGVHDARPSSPWSSAWAAWVGCPAAPGWAFFGPQPPYGGMAEQALVPRGMWLPVPDGIDDVTAAAVTNPGLAAWKTLLWEDELAPGQTVLVLGATGTSGRIATPAGDPPRGPGRRRRPQPAPPSSCSSAGSAGRPP